MSRLPNSHAESLGGGIMLELRNVTKTVGAAEHIRDVSLTLQHGSLNVLLGPTLSGKTSLMRLMAGLDVPTSGSVWFDGKDVTGIPVQKRNVAMVYQQFINYPAMTVYENIASPLRVAGTERAKIDKEVRNAAALLKLTPYLDRTPLSLSGGQQQRTALARAIVKNASLVLLDEPLANLDYKLREELRAELPKIFAATGTIFVYATTEPHEALLLGGNTATLSEGRITQFGPTIDVFRRPNDLVTAKTFADPPLNTIVLKKRGSSFLLDGGVNLPVPAELAGIAGPSPSAVAVRAKVSVTEITGSESFVHLDFADVRWVMLEHGILVFEPDQTIEVFIDPRHIMVFDANSRSAAPPHMLAA
jgi:glycerol transport system ATP-binding protein